MSAFTDPLWVVQFIWVVTFGLGLPIAWMIGSRDRWPRL